MKWCILERFGTQRTAKMFQAGCAAALLMGGRHE